MAFGIKFGNQAPMDILISSMGRSKGLIADCPAINACQNVVAFKPSPETVPSPVITTRRFIEISSKWVV